MYDSWFSELSVAALELCVPFGVASELLSPAVLSQTKLPIKIEIHAQKSVLTLDRRFRRSGETGNSSQATPWE